MNGAARDVVATLLAQWRQAHRVVALTGAGMSTESGLPDFRSAGGLWRRFRPEQLASTDALRNNPSAFYDFYRWRVETLLQAQPHPGHYALTQLQQQGRLGPIITQNVDGLHHAAGSKSVLEVHGTLRTARCETCGEKRPAAVLLEQPAAGDPYLRCQCGGIVRPGVVLFGESLPTKPLERAVAAIKGCDALLVVGSSLVVHPVASLPQLALASGARLWIVNLERTPFDDAAHVVVRSSARDVLTQLAAALT